MDRAMKKYYQHTANPLERKMWKVIELIKSPIKYSLSTDTPEIIGAQFVKWAVVIRDLKLVINIADCYTGCPKCWPKIDKYTDGQKEAVVRTNRIMNVFSLEPEWTLIWIWSHQLIPSNFKNLAKYIDGVVCDVERKRTIDLSQLIGTVRTEGTNLETPKGV